MVVLAVLAVTMASIRGLEPTTVPSPSDKDHLLIQVVLSLGLDGRPVELTGRRWEDAVRLLTSRVVIDMALTDPWLSSLPELRQAADPRAALRRMIRLRSAESSTGLNGTVLFSVASSTNPLRAAFVVERAMMHRGLPPVTHIPTIYRGGPLDRPWKVAVAWALGLLAALVILTRPSRRSRRRSSEAVAS
jgi:hypothetical protein